ncbi:LPS export ABC transporter permease LptF [Candidatus Rariloculus sp.]|uniref:LPS export ABC transporter permease LptF n=1 Tax=Candidatus Rariloculus sp. TaxID=3101265 RepID=UPI003D0CC92B
MSLISRYIFREALGSSVGATAVLLLIFMGNQFAEILGDAAADRLPRDVVLAIFGLTLLRYLTLLSPIGLLLGLMLALARLNRDSEMAALSACGVGTAKLLRPISVLAIPLAVLVTWLALVKTPDASREIEQIKFEANASMDLGQLESGKFITPDSGRTVLYAQEVDGEELRDVFLQRERDGQIVVILADRAERIRDAVTGVPTLVFYDGRRYEGIPGQSDFSIAEFREHGIPIRADTEQEFVESVEIQPTAALFGSDDPEDRAELQWRLSAPLSLLILGALAIPLSRTSPRDGRYARVGVAFLIYLTYANTLSIARVWVERDEVPEWLGLWWVHVTLAVVASLLLFRDSGGFAGLRGARPVAAAST